MLDIDKLRPAPFEISGTLGKNFLIPQLAFVTLVRNRFKWSMSSLSNMRARKTSASLVSPKWVKSNQLRKKKTEEREKSENNGQYIRLDRNLTLVLYLNMMIYLAYPTLCWGEFANTRIILYKEDDKCLLVLYKVIANNNVISAFSTFIYPLLGASNTNYLHRMDNIQTTTWV